MSGLLALTVILLLLAGRHLTFFYDEWDFILHRRGESVGVYLDPHNGHLSLFPVVVYKLLLAVVGMRHYWPYRMVVIVLHAICGSLLYVIARRRLGPWLALIPAAALLLLGSAWEDLLWPFQMGFLGSVAAGLGALVLLDQLDPRPNADRRWHDRGACALLIVSLGSSAVGVPFLASAIVLLLAQRAPLRRWGVAALPAVLFLVWYLGWGTDQPSGVNAVLDAPQYIADAASAAASGLAGLSLIYGPPLLVMLVLVIVMRLRSQPLPPLLLAASGGAIVFWALSAVARADVSDPSASRYIYVGVVFLLLTIVEAARNVTIGRAHVAAVGLLLLGSTVANLGQLRTGERGLRASDTPVQAALGAVQLAANVVKPTFVPEPQLAPQVQAGAFLAAAHDFGSPALTVPQVEHAPARLQATADSVLARAELSPPASEQTVVGTRPLTVLATTVGHLAVRGDCVRFSARGPQDVLDLRFSGGGRLTIAPPSGHSVAVYLRRLAVIFSEPPYTRLAEPSQISFPTDLAPGLPWEVRLTSAAPFLACGA